MGEGTRTVDYGAELADLRRRIEALERRDYPPYSPAQWAPMMPAPMGCVCPVGAEFGCHSSGCPRLGPFHITAGRMSR